jgi:WD40 repeat protein
MVVHLASIVLGIFFPLSASPPATDPPRADRFGDALPSRALARLGTLRFRHGPANTVAFSPDGRSLAVGGRGLGIRLYDADTGRVFSRLGADESSYSTGQVGLAFSPDGKSLAAAHGPLRLIDLASGRDLWRQGDETLHASVVAFSPDGKLIASNESRGLSSTIPVWDRKNGKLIRRLYPNGRFIYHLTFSPDGKYLAAACEGAAEVYEVETGKMLHRTAGKQNNIATLGFSPDGQELAVSWGYEAKVHFLDPWTAKVRRVWDIPEGKCFCPTFSADGTLLATTDNAGVIRLWDRTTGAEVRQLRGFDSWVWKVAFSPDGKRMAAATHREAVFLWDTTTGERLTTRAGHDRPVTAVTFSRDGRELFSYGEDGRLLAWDWTAGTETFRFRAPPGMAYGGSLGLHAEVLVTRGDGEVHCWDFRLSQRERPLGKRLIHHTSSPLAVSPDGSLVAAQQAGATIFVGEPTTGKELHVLKGHSPNVNGFKVVTGLAFAPDGKTLASTAEDNTIRLWDARTGKETRTWETGNGHNMMLAFAPNGQTLALAEGGWGDSLRLWDTATATELTPAMRHRGCFSLAFSADGRLVAIGGAHDIEVWETATGQHVMRLSGHHSGVHSLTFHPGGRALASGAGDTTVLVWDLTEGMKEAGRLVDGEVPALWETLAGPAPAATRATWRLVTAPGQALALLKEHVRAASAPPPERLDKLITDLESDRFADRQKATRELEDLGELAEPALRVALARKPPLEASRRLERLLARCGPGAVPAGERLRSLRALMVLEQIGTPEAREMLRILARGAAAARLTREARAALDRLEKS